MGKKKKSIETDSRFPSGGYESVLKDVIDLIDEARRFSARTINAVMYATYWEIGRRIVEFEQHGKKRAEYGEELLKRLSENLSSRFGKGFSERNLRQMRQFYLTWQIRQTLSAISNLQEISKCFPLPGQPMFGFYQ